MSRRGPPWYLRSATESDDLVIHDMCLESQNVVGIPVARRTLRSAAEPTVIMIVSTWADGLQSDKAASGVSC